MVRARSTSPPKSAWPGVSTKLILTPFHVTDAALARMVIPRSRFWWLESVTHAVDDRLVSLEGARRSINASTSVVLPWSTCATRATLRSFIINSLAARVRPLSVVSFPSVVELVVGLVLIDVAVLLGERGVLVVGGSVLVVIGVLTSAGTADTQVNTLGPDCLSLPARFFEAAMTTLHERAPRT